MLLQKAENSFFCAAASSWNRQPMNTSRKATHVLLVLVVLASQIFHGGYTWCDGEDLPGKREDKALVIKELSYDPYEYRRISTQLQYYSTSQYVLGTDVEYECIGNNILEGPKIVVCSYNDASERLEWMPKEDPYCEPACPPLINDAAKRNTHLNISIEQPKGLPPIKPLPRLDCHDPPQGTDADMICKKIVGQSVLPKGTLVRIGCSTGCNEKCTEGATRCVERGGKLSWSHYADWKNGILLPTCKDPDLKENNVRILHYGKKSYIEGNVVVLGCSQGYVKESGNEIVKCEASGNKSVKWDHDLLKCQAQCKKTDEDDEHNVVLTSTSNMPFVDGSEAKYDCSEGYVFSEGDRTLYCGKCNKVKGASYIGCNADDTGLGWRGKYPSCLARCDLPKGLKNVKEDASQHAIYKDGDRFTVECEKDYIPVGNISTIDCTAAGWNSRIGCEKACSKLELRNGQVTYQPGEVGTGNYRHRTMAKFKCKEGFHLSRDSTQRCVEGEWWGDKPECYKDCSSPVESHTAHQSHEGKSFKRGTEIEFVCNNSHLPLKGSDMKMKCEEESSGSDKSQWKPRVITCVRACDMLDTNSIDGLLPIDFEPDIPESDKEQSLVRPNTKAQFKCQEGHKLVGEGSKTCEASGQWSKSEDLPTCEALCEGFPEVKNGEPTMEGVANDSKYLEQDKTMPYRCDKNYVLNKTIPTSVVCERATSTLVKPRWSSPTPQCVPACSVSLLDVANLGFSFSDKELDKRSRLVPLGTTVTYGCKGMFKLEGAAEATCGADKKWNPLDLPACKPLCPTPPKSQLVYPDPVTETQWIHLDTERPEKYYSPGSTVTYVCKEGFILKGLNVSTCGEDHQWSLKSPPHCQQMCPTPPKSQLANPVTEKLEEYYSPGATVTYVCKEGFILKGLNVSTCGEDHKWSLQDPPSCQQQCPPPPKYQLAYTKSPDRNYSEWETVTYACKEGFKLESKGVYTCGKDHHWSPKDPPDCKPLCPKPPKSQLAFPDTKDNQNYFRPRETVTYTCKEGFKRIDGLNVSTCGTDHKWSPEVPLPCQKLCPTPPKSQLAHPDPQNPQKYFSPGEPVTYVCEEGAVKPPHATMQVLCSGDRDNVAFLGPLPTCDPTCGAPSRVRNAKMERSGQTGRKDQSTIGTVVRYTCHPNYVLRHEDIHSLTCLVSTGLKAMWTGHLPICDPTCPIPTSNRTNVKTDRRLCFDNDRCRPEAEVQVHCKSGFYAPKTGLRKCEATGPSKAVWSPGLPHCVPMCSYKDLTNAQHTNQSVCNEEQYCIPGQRVQLKCPRGFAFESGTPEWPLCNGTDQAAEFAEEVPNCMEKFVEDRSEEERREREERERKEKEEAKKDKEVVTAILSVGGLIILAIVIGLVIFVVRMKRMQSDGDQVDRTDVGERGVSGVPRAEKGLSKKRKRGKSDGGETERTEKTERSRQSSSKGGTETTTTSRTERGTSSRTGSTRASARNATYDRRKTER